MTPEGRIGRAGAAARVGEPDHLLAYDAVRLFVERATAARPSFSCGIARATRIRDSPRAYRALTGLQYGMHSFLPRNWRSPQNDRSH